MNNRKLSKTRNWNQQRKRRFYSTRDSLYNRKRKVDRIFGRPMYYDRQGRAISMLRWAQLSEKARFYSNPKLKRVAATTTKGGHWISTVWLGMDHRFMFERGNKPVIFETMIFCQHDNADEAREKRAEQVLSVGRGEMTVEQLGESELPEIGCDLDSDCWRYCYENEALKGHNRTVSMVRQHEKAQTVLATRALESQS
jgi:hypothetical protein